MQHLTEDKVKKRLSASGVAVPRGAVAMSPDQAAELAREFAGPLVIKALVPTGRRGKSGAIRFTDGPEEARQAAAAILGTIVNGHLCDAVYIEQRVAIERELSVYGVQDLRTVQPQEKNAGGSVRCFEMLEFVHLAPLVRCVQEYTCWPALSVGPAAGR